MTCSDVGLAYICCENVRDGLPLNAVITSERKRAPRRKPAKKVSAGMEESLDCPQNSIGLLKSDGSRVVCNSRSKCPGSNTFCHGNLKRSVCCERIEFASDILNSPIKTPSKDVAVTPAKKRDGNGTPKAVHAKSVMVSEKVEHSAVMTPVHKELPKKKTVKNVSIAAPQEAKHFMDDTAQVTSSPKPPPSTTTEKVPSTSEAAAPAPPSAGFRNQHVARDQAEIQPPLPSQLFSKQDKRAMAQQFLMHQIRNGWPYDDRFYRPDLDAFSSEQRRDMARIQFSDN
ncbi:hypothetical protein Q1695_000911 [Nippostrongylus brasiliensis]|nr:hypothetical protein Q1695_000911 [Nippostrongylus brasiliensis]